MFYPDCMAKPDGSDLKLRTLDRVWLQGRLRMWGRWALVRRNQGAAGILSKLICDPMISKAALQRVKREMTRSGITSEELQAIFDCIKGDRAASSLLFLSDDEGMMIDSVIARVLSAGQLNVVKEHYCHRKSCYQIAVERHEKDPSACLRTYQNRVNAWLAAAEFALFKPLRNALKKDS